MVPNMIVNNGEQRVAPFEDATGAHAGALLGDVRHDPFQSGGMETPSHDRVEPGSIHKSNKGVLFVDEINTLDIRTQQKLMTAIQEGEFAITGQSERSSGAMVQTEPVPCDFIMVAAGNLDAMENMHPALRNRIKGYGYEVYMDDTIEDTPEMRRKYARFIAQEVERDGRLPTSPTKRRRRGHPRGETPFGSEESLNAAVSQPRWPGPRRGRHRPRRGSGFHHPRRRPAGQGPLALDRATARRRLHRAPQGLRATGQ